MRELFRMEGLKPRNMELFKDILNYTKASYLGFEVQQSHRTLSSLIKSLLTGFYAIPEIANAVTSSKANINLSVFVSVNHVMTIIANITLTVKCIL